MCPLEASASERRFIVPSQRGITDFYINCSQLVKRSAQLNQSSWILSQLQETAKHIFSIFI